MTATATDLRARIELLKAYREHANSRQESNTIRDELGACYEALFRLKVQERINQLEAATPRTAEERATLDARLDEYRAMLAD